MKKNLTALLISSLLLLTACNEKDPQLQAELEKTKQQLIKTQSALNTANEELSKVRSEIPALFVKEIEVFNQSELLTREKPANNDIAITEVSVSNVVTSVDTGVQWLNNLMYERIWNTLFADSLIENPTKNAELKAIKDPKLKLEAYLAYNYELQIKSAKEFTARSSEHSLNLSYLGQRGNMISFSEALYIDEGGAHPNGWTNYIHVDVKKKAILDLSLTFGENNLESVRNLVWEEYKLYNAQRGIDKEENYFISKESFEIPENFYFSPNGVSFVFAPYAIGSYAEGEITLTLPWEIARDILNPDYVW